MAIEAAVSYANEPISFQESPKTDDEENENVSRRVPSKLATALAWWKSPWGPGPLLKVALPLMISAGFVSLTLFTDRTLLYWRSESAAAAAMSGGAMYWTIICFPGGLLSYLATFVAQYRGAGKPHKIGLVYHHAMRLAWCFVPFMLLLIALSHKFFVWAGHDSATANLEAGYLRILLVGGLGALFYFVQSGLLIGETRTRTVLAIDAVATVVNLGLDAVLIFGFGSIPALGVWGAAIATAASFWLKVPIAYWVIRSSKDLVTSRKLASSYRLDLSLIGRLLRFGSPAGLQMLAESGCFAVIMLQVGRLGNLQMAATTLALGLNILAFVPMIGLGIGVGVMVGQRLTEGRPDLARRTVACALGVALTYTSLFAVLLGVTPTLMLSLYEWGTPVERFQEMRPLLTPLLGIIAVYCILDGLQVVFVGAIKGAGDTWFVLIATSLVSLSVIGTGFTLQEWLGPHLMLWWYVIAAWVASMGLVFGARYYSGVWEKKRVIEPNLE